MNNEVASLMNNEQFRCFASQSVDYKYYLCYACATIGTKRNHIILPEESREPLILIQYNNAGR